ncbi:M56 family metallopeptidase [Hymenobacter defluvii]|uniref:TonB family protein n=1 Tax=Hymenobacter defluvii TaxID=2054411 RepID=A0ABS3TCS4_9BACT|nr:M56 family metallopeptidase [Hymenobacter defluvii]MBO3271133.1 TonB family protein [Hymenobacter defluvii]
MLFHWLWLSTLLLGALWLFYYLGLRREQSFRYNRVLLVLAPLLAATLPLLPLPALELSTPLAAQQPLQFLLPEATANAEASHSVATAVPWLVLCYGIGVALLLARLGGQLWQLWRFAQSLPVEQRTGYTLRRTSGRRPTSSFGRTVFWDDSLPLTPAEGRQILAHELAHVRQHHTLDRLWLRVWQAVLWPNPFVHLLPPALHLTHEYLADEAAAATAPTHYVGLLARQATRWLGQTPTLAHSFFSSSTLTRIAMLNRPSVTRRWKQWLALPLGCVLLGVVACEKNTPADDAALSQTASQAASMPAPPPPPPPVVRNAKGEQIYNYVEQMPEPPGGMGGLLKYIGENIQYPKAAMAAKLEGRSFVSFTINKEGDIENVYIQKGIFSPEHEAAAQAMNDEAMRVVKQLPRWTPGKQDGQPVNVSFTIPVTYMLEK